MGSQREDHFVNPERRRECAYYPH